MLTLFIMKKRVSISKLDYYLFGIACLLLGIVFSGILLNIKPISFLFLFVKYKWAFLALAVIIGVKPWWIAMFGKRSAEGLPDKKITKKKISAKRKISVRKKGKK